MRTHTSKKQRNRTRTNHLSMNVGAGSAGDNAIGIFIGRMPSQADMSFALDGEISQERAARNDHLFTVPDLPIPEFQATRHEIPILANDARLGELQFPHSTEAAAGAIRCIGVLKAAGAFDLFSQRVSHALTSRLGQFDAHERPIIDVNFITASGGGFGGGLIAPLSIITRNLIRNLIPQARTYVHAHLILANNYEKLIAEPEIRTKIRANEFATLLELNWIQDPDNAAALCDLLDCDPIPDAIIDYLIPYSIGDGRARAATLDQILGDRVMSNILATGDVAVADYLRARGANENAWKSARKPIAKPFVRVCQAYVLAVPDVFGRCWALGEARKPLRATLAKPSPERLKGFQQPLQTAIGLTSIQNDAARLGDDLPADLPIPAALETAQISTAFMAAYRHFDTTIRPAIDRAVREAVAHFEANVLPRTINAIRKALVERHATIHELATLHRAANRMIQDQIEQTRRRLEESVQTGREAREAFHAAAQQAGTKGQAARAKETAIEQFKSMRRSELETSRLRAYFSMLQPLGEALSRAAENFTLFHAEGVKALATIEAQYKEAGRLATYQSPTMASVITSEELDEALKRTGDGIRETAASLPEFNTDALIQSGHLAVPDAIRAYIDALEAVFEDYYDTHLIDVSGTIKALGLQRSVRRWTESGLQDIAPCSPIRANPARAVTPQTLIAATGDDLATVRQIEQAGEFPKFIALPGSDPRSVIIYCSLDNLTIEAIPTFSDARRAAEKHPKPGTARKAWEELASSEHLLPAFDQAGLVPKAWVSRPDDGQSPEVGRHTREHTRFAPTALASANGDGFASDD